MIRRPLQLCLCALCLSPALQAQQPRFRNVTATSGLRVPLEAGTPGVGVGDYDRDGWVDVVISGVGAQRTPRVFRNLGASRQSGDPWFVDVTASVMPVDAEPASVSYLADLDNDGDLDMLSTRRFVDATNPLGNRYELGLMYYENVGGTFVKGTSQASVAHDDQSNHGGMALGDLDADGDLDIVFAHNGGGNPQYGPAFYVRNDGLPNLVDATADFGADLGQRNRWFTTVLADFDGDLDLDIHNAVDFFPDYGARNDGSGAFTNVSSSSGVSNGGADMGIAVGDMDNDGDLDIYSTNINIGVLYVNDGTGHFSDQAVQRGAASWISGFGQTLVGWGVAFSDVDLDQDLDIVFCGYSSPGHLFVNDGTGYFDRRTTGSGLKNLLGHGLVDFDYDRDGDVDVLVMRTGKRIPALYENTTPRGSRHWLAVELEGTTSNRDGVGAKVEVTTPDGLTQMRPILAGYSFKSGPPMAAHFGLGTNSRVPRLRVTWPSGIVQDLVDVQADRLLHIVEP